MSTYKCGVTAGINWFIARYASYPLGKIEIGDNILKVSLADTVYDLEPSQVEKIVARSGASNHMRIYTFKNKPKYLVVGLKSKVYPEVIQELVSSGFTVSESKK